MDLKVLFQVYQACSVLNHFGFKSEMVCEFIKLYDLYHQSNSNVSMVYFDKFFNVMS